MQLMSEDCTSLCGSLGLITFPGVVDGKYVLEPGHGPRRVNELIALSYRQLRHICRDIRCD